MEPRIVDQAPQPPGQCLFSQDIDGPWIDLGVVAPWIRPYGYLSVKYVEGIARDLLGMVPAAEIALELEDLQERLASYAKKFEDLETIQGARETLEEAVA